MYTYTHAHAPLTHPHSHTYTIHTHVYTAHPHASIHPAHAHLHTRLQSFGRRKEEVRGGKGTSELGFVDVYTIHPIVILVPIPSTLMTSISAMRISSCDVTFRQCPWDMGLNEEKELDRGREGGGIGGGWVGLFAW